MLSITFDFKHYTLLMRAMLDCAAHYKFTYVYMYVYGVIYSLCSISH